MLTSNRIFQRALITAAVGIGMQAVAGCGGSSSETPPPLEPNLHEKPALPAASASASAPSAGTSLDLGLPPSSGTSTSTWGTGRPLARDGGF